MPPQGPIDATGFVKTTDSSPVPGATLRLTNTDTRQIWVSWTDPTGKFEFPTLTPGHYTIEATQLGFAPASTEAQFSTPPPQPPALQLILRVATLAELTAPAESNQPERGRGQRPNGGAPGTGQNAANGPPGGRGGRGGQGGQGGGRRGGQLPQGLLNAMQQGLAGGGFQQTDVTGASEGGDAGIPEANAPVTPTVGGSSDSFLLQGTVGQGLSYNAGGFPGGGFRGPDGPGGGPSGDAGEPGGAAGQMFGGGAGPGGGGPGGPGGGPGGGFGGGRGGRAIMIFNTGGGGGRGGPLGRLFRQQVNRIRYSFYDSYQNSAFDARPYAITGTPAPKVGHYDERVGGNMGGPLKIPHIYNGADHTYFFLNYQHETVSNAINTFSTVPTADQRNGCFPTGTIFQPFTTTPVTTQGSCAAGDDQVPIDPVAQKLLNFIPKPTPTTSGLNGTQNYLLQAATPENTDRVNGTILHTINAKFNVNGSYNFSSQREDTLSNFVGIGGHDSTRSQNLTLGLSHNWTPHVVETTSVNWSRNRVQLLSDNSYNSAFSPASLGINLGPGTPLAVDYGIPQVSFTTYSGFNDPIPSLVRNQTFRVDDNISWTHAKHTMRFGGEVRRVHLNTQSNPNPRGGFVFTGIATGNEFADFLEGLPFNTTGQFGNPNTYFRGWGFDLYAQDDFRITKTFTAQFGLRYDAVTPPIELANNIVNLDITDLALVTTVQPGAAGVPRSLIHGQYHNFEPRIGIAWQPPIRPKTVVRAGYSIFYNTSIYDTLVRELAYQPPIDTAQTLTTAASPNQLTFQNPFVGGSSNLIAISNTQSVDPNYKPGYAQIWSLGTETSISQNWVLDLTYTGNEGNESRHPPRAQSRAARHTLGSDPGQSYRQPSRRIHLRSVRRQFDLQCPSGARSFIASGRDFSSSASTPTLNRSTTRVPSAARAAAAPSSSRTATSTPNTAFRPLTSATSSASSPCGSCPSASATAARITAGSKRYSAIGASRIFLRGKRELHSRLCSAAWHPTTAPARISRCGRISSATRIRESAAVRLPLSSIPAPSLCPRIRAEISPMATRRVAQSKARARSAGMRAFRKRFVLDPSSAT